MRNFLKFCFIIFAPLVPQLAVAFVTPLSVAVVPPVQFPSSEFSVAGARFSLLWGRHRDIYGLDLGLLGNVTDQAFVGTAISGLANVTHGTTTIVGGQLAGAVNYNGNKTEVFGLQMALGVNYNEAQSVVAGVQFALIANLSSFTDIYGAQIGLYNRAQSVHGFQIGLVNVTNNLHGLQIGLVNFNHSGPFAVSPIINVGF